MNDERLATVRRAFEELVSGMETGDAGVLLRGHGHHHRKSGGSGLPMDHTWTYLATESDGRVIRFEAFLDPPDTRP